jgi:hypothetical protein
MHKLKLSMIGCLCALGAAFAISMPDCNPKFTGTNVCDSLRLKNDADFMLFYISMKRPPPDSEENPEKRAQLKIWTQEMFTKYELWSMPFPDPVSKRLAVPSDSDQGWIYGQISMTKKTALELVDENYVLWLQITRIPTVGIGRISEKTAKTNPKRNVGRDFERRSLNGKRLPEIEKQSVLPFFRVKQE